MSPAYCPSSKSTGLYDNPLLNSLILKLVFDGITSSVTVKDLKCIRLVCNAWQSESLYLFKNKASLRLGYPVDCCKASCSSLPQSNIKQNVKSHLPVNVFLKLVDTKRTFGFLRLNEGPFKNMTLTKINFEIDLPEELDFVSGDKLCVKRNLWTFLNSIGHTLKSFEFENCFFGDLTFIKLIKERLNFIVSLRLTNNEKRMTQAAQCKEALTLYESMELGNCLVEQIQIVGSIPIKHSTFFRVFNNLRHFSYSNTHQRHLLSSMIYGRLQTEGPLQTLKSLDVIFSRFFSDRLYMRILKANLKKMCIQLEFLSLTLESSSSLGANRELFSPEREDDVINVLYPMLEMFDRSLKTLILYRPAICNVLKVNPFFHIQMPVLEVLKVYGNAFDSFLFLKYTPHLKQLRIDTYGLSKIMFMKNLYCPNKSFAEIDWLKRHYSPYMEDMLLHTPQHIKDTLVLHYMCDIYMECAISADTICFFARSMPNLKSFGGLISVDVWKALCEYLPNLQCISISQRSEVSDAEISGYSKSSYMCAEKHRNTCNITVFKNLKIFRYDACCGECKIGDVSVLYGFLEIHTLNEIKLVVDEKLTPEQEDTLKTHVVIVNIERVSNKSCRGTRKCCKRKHFLQDMLI